MTVREIIRSAERSLEENGTDDAEFEARQLLVFAAGVKHGGMDPCSEINRQTEEKFSGLLFRRLQGEPLQYILGEWDFYRYSFYCGSGVLIPRPETEELTEKCIRFIKKHGVKRVLDLCSGTGCIGISIALDCPQTEVVCVEKYDAAYSYLVKNIEKHGVKNVIPVKDDALAPSKVGGTFGLIVSNPPYIESCEIPLLQKEVLSEPLTALDGGKDGLDFYRAIKKYRLGELEAGGLLAVECGEKQTAEVAALFSDECETECFNDIYGNPRIVTALKKTAEPCR